MSSPSSPDRAPLPPPASLAIHLDLVGGIAGDMFVAALVDALPALRDLVVGELAAVRPASSATPRFHDAASGGLRARRFSVAPAAHAHLSGGVHDHSGAPTVAAREHAHAGTAYAVLRRQLADAGLTPPTRTHALALLAL